MKKDLFGFDKQGTNYQKYRPKYSKTILEKSIQSLTNKNRYLDIAVGTGQILFQLFHHFKQSVGIDISPKMLSVCQQRFYELKDSKQFQGKFINFKNIDFLSPEFGKDNNKYDLITIGQALHWLPIQQSLKKMSNLIEKNGTVAIYAYILKGVQGDTVQQTQRYSKAFYQFYDKRVKSHFDFDRNQLHEHYKLQKYPFEKIFPKIERVLEEVTLQMPGSHYISYLQTFSGYNTYLQKNKDDPISFIKEVIPSQKQIKVKYDYFAVLCKNQ